jgi:hypothetical protein
VLFTLLAAGGLARAEKGEVVVLPMTSTARSLQIYERAISTALAQELSKKFKKPIRAVSSASDVPKSATLIIEGRLVAKGRDRVLLEARVRQARTGRALATLATKATNTTSMDALVARLASQLLPAIRKGLKPAAPVVLPVAKVKPGPKPEQAPDTQPFVVPDMLVIPAGGSAARGVVAVREPATTSVLAMLSRMGMSAAVSSSFQGVENVNGAMAELHRSGAKYLLMMNVREVNFSYRAVLSARGTVQVAVMGTDGVPVFAKTVSTDTVVGSRGDRHQALVYQVATQALDMLLPEFRKLVEEPEEGAGG